MKAEIKVPVDWRPREYQLGLWNAIVSGEKKRAACVWHRRAGKDHEAINIIAVSMFKRPGTYWHVLPTYAQGEKAIWAGMDNDGRKFIDYIPKEAVESRRNDKMLLKVYDELGGAQYQVIGGDNPDRLMGANPIGVVFSEYALMNPLGWDLVRPILNANGGWAIFIYTPRGHNHGYTMLQQAKTSDKWYTETLDITQTRKHDGTPVVTEADVAEEIRAGMPEELARQEYYCDFSAPLVGAYYGREFDKIDKEGRLGDGFKWRKEYPVNTCWDLGIRDTMAIWFYQVIEGWVHWIDYEAGTGGGIEEYIKVLDRKPYVYKKHYAPHDVSKRELGTGTSVIETAARLGLRFTMVPRTRNLDDDINACRLVLARSRFATGEDERGQRVENGVEALRQYRKEFDYKNKVWAVRPTHDWTSHCFAGETKVLTRYGTRCIMDLSEKGEVLTLCGWKQYRNPRISKKNARLVEVVFDDGTTVRCTPDHLFLTERGWRSASALRRGSWIRSASIPSHSILRGVSTDCSRVSGISEIREFCTVMYGKARSVLRRMGATFTTGTVTLQTTSCGTSSVLMPRSISARSGTSETTMGRHQKSARKLATRRLSGTAVQRGASGTADTRSGRKAGRSGSGLKSPVNTVVNCIRHWFVRGTRRNTAAMLAKPLRIESVEWLNETADVWDITVPGVEHFALANGAIVHNSADGFRTGCVTMPREAYTVKEVPRFPGTPTFREALEEHDKIVAEGGKTSYKRL